VPSGRRAHVFDGARGRVQRIDGFAGGALSRRDLDRELGLRGFRRQSLRWVERTGGSHRPGVTELKSVYSSKSSPVTMHR
jgi:hypothetical protein